jgi:hypothetical protein
VFVFGSITDPAVIDVIDFPFNTEITLQANHELARLENDRVMLGFIGREEGIAAMAVASVDLPAVSAEV